MIFLYPAVLLFLWVVPLAAVGWVWMRRRSRVRLGRISLAAGQGPVGTGAERRFRAQLAMAAAGAALALVAAARPCWGMREEIVISRGRNVVLAVDVSRSMLAEDVRPNRLERARADLRDLIADLRGDRAGLLAFRGAPVLVCPLTTDAAFLRQALEGLSTDSAPRGETDLGKAVTAAVEALDAFPGDHNAILLISDGEDLAGNAIVAARRAGERGIPVFTVGIGDTHGVTIPSGDGKVLRYQDETVATRLDNQTLLDIAAASGGAYIPLQTAGTGRVTLGTLYQRHLRAIAAREMQERTERRRVERFQLFLVPAILCFLGLAMLSVGRPVRRRRSPRVVPSATVGIVLAAGLPLFAGQAAKTDVGTAGRSARALAREAQEAFRAGRDAEAAEAYETAAAEPSLDARTAAAFRYNAAIAQLRAGAATNAAANFRLALREGAGGTPAREGLGAALYEAATQRAEDGEPTGYALPPDQRLALLEESASAFQQVLRDADADEPQRRNLAAASALIPRLRDEARLAEILQQHGQSSPADLLAELLRRQRDAYAEAASAATNRGPGQIGRFEKSARLQRDAADLWLPLAPQLIQQLAQAVTNEEQRARLEDRIAGARSAMRSAAERLADLDPAGRHAVARQEQETLGLLMSVAPPPLILEEAIHAQTNTLRAAVASPRTPAEDQAAARMLAELFQRGFPDWADSLAAAPPAPSGSAATEPQAPEPLTDEARAEIERLARETLQMQGMVLDSGTTADGALEPGTLEAREQALANLLRIRELLPKQPPQPQQSPSESPPEKDSSQEQAEPQEADESNEPEQGEPEQDEPPEDDQQKEPPEVSGEEPLSEDLQTLMERVLRLEKEREEERRRRQRELPPLLNERDW